MKLHTKVLLVGILMVCGLWADLSPASLHAYSETVVINSGAEFIDSVTSSGAEFIDSETTAGAEFIDSPAPDGAEFIDSVITSGAEFID